MARGKLFLAGGGSEKASYEIDKEFVLHLGENKKILYIPVAIDTKKHPYTTCLKWMKSIFNKLGIRYITMWTDLKNKSYEDINKFGAIYIGGGNTYYLAKLFKETKFDFLLKLYFEGGGIIYGGSAGAIILGKDIDTAASKDKNTVQIKNTKGLNLAQDFAIWCHYHKKDDKIIHRYIKEKKQEVLAIPEKSGVLIEKNKLTVVGKNGVVVFDKENKKSVRIKV